MHFKAMQWWWMCQIALHRRKNPKVNLELILDSHSSYFPLQYPIFFPFGAQQWDNLYKAWTDQGTALAYLERTCPGHLLETDCHNDLCFPSQHT
jgi:hypothetical protein